MLKQLTIEKLKEMKPGTIFASGVGLYPEVTAVKIKWVAVRGGIWDWCIYYHHANMDESFIRNHGDKCFTKSAIKKLIPCTEEAFNLYRY